MLNTAVDSGCTLINYHVIEIYMYIVFHLNISCNFFILVKSTSLISLFYPFMCLLLVEGYFLLLVTQHRNKFITLLKCNNKFISVSNKSN